MTSFNSCSDALLHLLEHEGKPISVPDMLEKLQPTFPTLNKTTVYRALEKLVENHLVHEVHLQNKRVFYELAGEHHHHLVCTVCQHIEEVHLPHHLENIERDLEKSTGFTIAQHHLEFFGVCQKCQNK